MDPTKNLTLDYLHKVRAQFETNEPKRRPIVGFIMNPDVLTRLKKETAKMFSVATDLSYNPFDYLFGAPIWVADISPKHIEVYYDPDLLQKRLKQLKIVS